MRKWLSSVTGMVCSWIPRQGPAPPVRGTLCQEGGRGTPPGGRKKRRIEVHFAPSSLPQPKETTSGQDDRADRRRRPQTLSLPRRTQEQAARGLDRGAGNLRGQQPYQEHRRRLRSRRLSRLRVG